jgi:purine-cytosine permease-like protein
MGLVWVTMVTAFPTVIFGVEWFKKGFSLREVLLCAFLSCLLLLAYAIPATQLGARSGLGYCALSRTIFGRLGTWLVTGNLIWMFVAWYGLTAVWMACAIRDFLHVGISATWMAVAFAFLMAFNNFFGFSGVANFARFFAAPALIVWVGYTFCKAVSMAPVTAINEPAHQTFIAALTTISSFVIGFAAWGNEMDYWKYSKPGALKSAIPLAVAVLIGQIIFPVSGWLIARMTGITETSAATTFLNNFSFAGMAILGVIILAASYFAANDSTMFGSCMALESLRPFKHRTSVTVLAVVGAIAAAILSVVDSAKAIEIVASLNCILMPTPTVILLTEWFLQEKIFRKSWDFSYVPSFADLPTIRWPATIALLAGISVGVATSGMIPALEWLHVGICPIQTWLTAAMVYAILRGFEHAGERADRQVLAAAQESERAVVKTGR